MKRIFACLGEVRTVSRSLWKLQTYFLLALWLCCDQSEAVIDVGKVYASNETIYARNGPYIATRNLVVQAGVNLTIQEGVEIRFSPGVGIVVEGTLHAVGNPFLRIRFLPEVDPPENEHDYKFPNYRLVDGTSTRQGRLQVKFRNEWRAVCTMNTNWTDIDYHIACRSMGFGSGAFWKWYKRNNDTRPFVMPRPNCNADSGELSNCSAWQPDRIRLGENLCQGLDDVGIMCWGHPSFKGSQYNWHGVRFLEAASHLEAFDEPPGTGITAKRVSNSRLEWVDIYYAGYSAEMQNITAAIFASGVPPVMNYLEVFYSAGDGILMFESRGPVEITNSTIRNNRGHGIIVYNTMDGRLFVNETRVDYNFGDGIQYSRYEGFVTRPIIGDHITGQTSIYYSEPDEFDRIGHNICQTELLRPQGRQYYPRIIEASLSNGTAIKSDDPPCQTLFTIPEQRPYTFTVQFLDIQNLNPDYLGTTTKLIICNTGTLCNNPEYELPIYDGIFPPSVTLPNLGYGLWIGLKHLGAPNDRVVGNIRVVMRVQAAVKDQVVYGLNVTNSRITDNLGMGIFLHRIRDRVVINNVTISRNQHLAGVHVLDGAADIWINRTVIEENWGDGINISYVGGSTLINGTLILNNRLRGVAFHYNSSGHFMPLHQDITFRGKMGASSGFLPTKISGNGWGGVLVGNFCANAWYRVKDPFVSVQYVEFLENSFHPAFEYHSCQRSKQEVTTVEFTGSACMRSNGFCLRVQPAVNIKLRINDNTFADNKRQVMIVRNRDHPQLWDLPAEVSIERNEVKNNRGPFVLSIGLNENAPRQSMTFWTQNQIKQNTVFNPYPYLNARNRPYAALIVSSSNVVLMRNCFDNPQAAYELATDLDEHAKTINATENYFGGLTMDQFMEKIFDGTKRYNLATFLVAPYATRCNAYDPMITPNLGWTPKVMDGTNLGGIIYSNLDLKRQKYTVVNDLHVAPGARLTIEPGAILEFDNSVGMLVQGELVRAEFGSQGEFITFTSRTFKLPPTSSVRIVNDDGQEALSGRLEVKINDQWGTVCNRSWNVDLAGMVCHQLGMVLDPEFLENWWTFPVPGTLPIIMDIVRCYELELEITDCWIDSLPQNVNMSCRPTDVVGIRCVEPHWAGVRYTLLADPPATTELRKMHHWIIERAGLLDYAYPEFAPALQIDWNYHVFTDLVIRNNFWTGLDIVYNDLVMKASVTDSRFVNNRRHGVRIRSYGLTMERVIISDNENAGLRYDPILSRRTQQDVVTWLNGMDALGGGRVIRIPDPQVTTINLDASRVDSRKFLLATDRISPATTSYKLTVRTRATARIGVQIVNRPSNLSDEAVVFTDASNFGAVRNNWTLSDNLIDFPLVTESNMLTVTYTRSYGPTGLVVMLFYVEEYQYISPFLHVYTSVISGNQYGVSTLHYSNFSQPDGSVINRYSREQLWFQKVNFTHNKQAVIWVNGPLMDAHPSAPLSRIEYFIDNCSISENNGSIIETHKDLYRSANVFRWWVWRSSFRDNDQSGFSVALPWLHNPFLPESHQHEFKLTESDFQYNNNFEFMLTGYYAFVNISANNFTNNRARPDKGLFRIAGMEKLLWIERNRWHFNKGRYILLYDTQSQTLLRFNNTVTVPATIHNNYLTQNYYLADPKEPLVEHYPRSFALGLLGVQKVNITLNNFRNDLMDFEAVAGLRGQRNLSWAVNMTNNYWGKSNGPEIASRIFDFDDWNIYSIAQYSPYLVTEDHVYRWDWRLEQAQTGAYTPTDPSPENLQGRLYGDLILQRKREKWPGNEGWRDVWKPDRPYRIYRDLTIMPGASLTIEKGVEIHLYPNVRILVLGTLVADGTFYDPIRFRPINITELLEQRDPLIYGFSTTTTASPGRFKRHMKPVIAERRREKREDLVYRKFPLLHRQDSFYQTFTVHLLAGAEKNRSGYLEIWNSTTGEMVPICDRQFTRRNAEVVCRELGHETQNVYVWIGERWDYDPRIRVVKYGYSEPRQCTGWERKMQDCDLRLTTDKGLWSCHDSEHFVYIDCGPSKALKTPYVDAWGGITFSSLPSAAGTSGQAEKQSVLRHVEILGAGFPHNESGSALEIIFHAPTLERVNVTNSSFHGVNIIAPSGPVSLSQLNITNNQGIGLNILTLNLQREDRQGTPLQNASYPYYMFGFIDMCSCEKEVEVSQRVLVYYKYDSVPVDCVKIFRTPANAPRQLAFNFLQFNMYDTNDDVGRPDVLRFYKGSAFKPEDLITTISRNTTGIGAGVKSPGAELGVFLRANAADGTYGFIAEVITQSIAAPSPLKTVTVIDSIFENNARGAMRYASMGEQSPDLEIERCYMGRNGYHVWGNFTTSHAAAELNLHNTQRLKFYSNNLWRNQGGLHIYATSTTTIARLDGLIKGSAFSQNNLFETLRLEGRGFQKLNIVNNYFGKNYCPYRDVIYVNQMITNFTRNIIYNNTGTHVLDLTGYPDAQMDFQVFIHNYVYNNLAKGHGYQYNETYGYFPAPPARVTPEDVLRKKRQAVTDDPLKTSFEWWAEVGQETERYRSTILAGTSQQQYIDNYFVNPANDFELTTVNSSNLFAYRGPVDARRNWWGYDGDSVAAGRIRDKQDYPYLIDVDYKPALQTNTTLLDADCPGGWFQAGQEEPARVKSCFLYVGGAMPYLQASQFCLDNDGFMPYFRESDPRMASVIAKLRTQSELLSSTTGPDSIAYSMREAADLRVWITGVMIPPQQCGYLSSRTGDTGYHNCELLLPFICEQGPLYTSGPFFLRPAGIAAIVLGLLLLLVLFLLLGCWISKSRRRKQQFFERKNSYRASLRSEREAAERAKHDQRNRQFEKEKRPPSPDIIADAHKRMIGLGSSVESVGVPTAQTLVSLVGSKKSLISSTTTTSYTTGYTTDTTTTPPRKKVSPTSSYTGESAYRSDYTGYTGYTGYTNSNTQSESTRHNVSGGSREVKMSRPPSLASFKPSDKTTVDTGFCDAETVRLRPAGVPMINRGTEMSQASTVLSGSTEYSSDHTGADSSRSSASTYRTSGAVSYDPRGRPYSGAESDDNRLSSASSMNTVTDSDCSSCRSSVTTLTEASGAPPRPPPPKKPGLLESSLDDTSSSINDASSDMRYVPMSVRALSANGKYYANGSPSSIHEEDPRDYMQGMISPFGISPARLPLGRHPPTFGSEGTQSQDSLLSGVSARNDGNNRSLGQRLDAWTPPNLSSFVRPSMMTSNTTQSLTALYDKQAKPLETAM